MANKEEQTDMSNKQNITESESNNNFEDKNSEEFRHVNQQKIKLNKAKLKEKEIKIESDTSSQTKNTPEEINVKHSLIMVRPNFFDKIKRCFRGEIRKIILIILIIISSIILIISIVDIINSIKNFFKSDKLLINNVFVFFIQIIYIFCLLIIQTLTLVSERKDRFLVNLIFLFIILILFISRILLYFQKNTKNSTLILNFLICFFITIINIVILLITLRIIKMKKNEQQNIEEIINITDIHQGTSVKITDNNNNMLIMNNSGTDNKDIDMSNNKEGINNLVEEADVNNKEDENSEQK